MRTKSEIQTTIETYSNLLTEVLEGANSWALIRIRILKQELEWVLEKR